MIDHVFTCFSAVQIPDLYILFAFFTFYGYITNSQCDQFPDILIAQLLELCIGIAEVMGSNPVRPAFFQALIVHFHDNCDDQSFSLHV